MQITPQARPAWWARPALLLAAKASVVAAITMAIFYAPGNEVLGLSGRIVFLHVPAAWASYVAFGAMAGASALYLRRPSERWDAAARSAAEVSFVFATVAIVSGAIWARAEWGRFWDWSDAKLFATLVMWLVLVGYLAMSGLNRWGGRQARAAAAYAVLGLVTVPMSFAANRIWNQTHPTLDGGSLATGSAITLAVGAAAFTLLCAALILMRYDIEMASRRLDRAKDELEADR